MPAVDKDFTRRPLGNGRIAGWATIGTLSLTTLTGLWVGGQAVSVLSGHGFARGRFTAGVLALWYAKVPGRAWQTPMPSAVVYWPITGILTVALLAAVIWLWIWAHGEHVRRRRSPKRLSLRPGMATRADIRDVMGAAALMDRALSLRPVLAAERTLRPEDVGWAWGTMHKQEVWTSVRDAVVLLGPSGAGKTTYVVVPRILAAPGALVVTSIRPDVLTPTMTERAKVGPVQVIAPDGSLDALPESCGWSPIYGCENGRTAIARAKVLVAGTSAGVQDQSYWETKSAEIVQYLLHAAALGQRGMDELWRWTKNPGYASAAAEILSTHPDAQPGWFDGLESIITADDRLRDNVWSGVATAFSGLDDAATRTKFDVPAGEQLDLVAFLRQSGTLYLVASENDPASRMLQCLVAEMTRAAKMIGDMSPGGRCEPPLTLMLDEIANFSPLPVLDKYISGYGGSGIVTFAVIQSLAQLEKGWGREAASAIWGASTIKVVLGGLTDAYTLRDLSSLTDDRDEETWATSHNDAGGNVSSQVRTKAVLSPGEIRGLDEGQALVLFKGHRPALVQMTPYFRGPPADRLRSHAETLQTTITVTASDRLHDAFGVMPWHHPPEPIVAALVAVDAVVGQLDVEPPPPALRPNRNLLASQKTPISKSAEAYVPLSFRDDDAEAPSIFETGEPSSTSSSSRQSATGRFGPADGKGTWNK